MLVLIRRILLGQQVGQNITNEEDNDFTPESSSSSSDQDYVPDDDEFEIAYVPEVNALDDPLTDVVEEEDIHEESHDTREEEILNDWLSLNDNITSQGPPR